MQNLQFTARVRRSVLPPGKEAPGYVFLLRESGGEEGDLYHTLSYYDQDKGLFYTFFRLCFEGVEFHEDHVYTFLVFSQDYTALDSAEPYPVSDSLFHFTISNSDTYHNMTTPKKSVYKRVGSDD